MSVLAQSQRWVAVWAVAAVLCGSFVACGEDGESGPSESAPVIGAIIVECGPFQGDGEQRFEGDALLRISAPVTDPDGDLAMVTAAYGGSIFTLESQGDENEFVYEQGGAANMLLRCEGGEVQLRAIDENGNVTEVKAEPSN